MKKLFFMMIVVVFSSMANAGEEQATDPSASIAEAMRQLQEVQRITQEAAAKRVLVKDEINGIDQRMSALQKQAAETQKNLEATTAARQAKEGELQQLQTPKELQERAARLVAEARALREAANTPGRTLGEAEVVSLEEAPLPKASKSTKEQAELPRPSLKGKAEKVKPAPVIVVEESDDPSAPWRTTPEPKQTSSEVKYSFGMKYGFGGQGAGSLHVAVAGFALKSTSSGTPEIFLGVRKGKLSGEMGIAFGDQAEHELFFMGASMGSMVVGGTSASLTGKLYFLEQDWVEPYLALGMEELKVDGSFSMGGIPFAIDGDGWHPVLKAGAVFPLTDHISATAELKVQDEEIVVTIPGGAGTATFGIGPTGSVGIVARF